MTTNKAKAGGVDMILTKPIAAIMNVGMGNTYDLAYNSKGESRNITRGIANELAVTMGTDIVVDGNKQPGVVDDTHIPLDKTKVGYVGKDCNDDPVNLKECNIKNKVVHITSKHFNKAKAREARGNKSLNLKLISSNTRSINNKKPAIADILETQNPDFLFCSEMNCRLRAPKFKGYISFQKKSERKFHGLGLYIQSHLSASVLRIPEDD